MASRQQLENEREFRLCRGNGPTDFEACRYWIENYAHIRHPERGRILFKLRDAQHETLRVWLSNRNTIVLKARQIGFSSLIAAMVLWIAFFWPDKTIILLSRNEREAKKLLAKSRYAYKFMPPWMRERGPQLTVDSQTLLPFDNESSVESLPSRDDPARGEAVYLVVVDEWAFLPNQEDAWSSIEPIADVGGRVIGLSTANGSGNFFHQFWVRARTGTSGFTPLFFPWSANTDRNDDWYENKSTTMLPWQIAQEYPRTEDEAFVKSGNPVFDTDDIALREARATQPQRVGQLVVLSGPMHYEFRAAEDGPLRIWELPKQATLDRYVIGADVAEGLEHGDYSAAHVVSVTTGRVVATWHGHIEADLFGEELARLGWWYGTPLIGVEVNGHGLTTCKALQRIGYRRIYYRHTLDERSKSQQRKIGWRTTKSSKPLMIDELGRAVRTDDLIVPCSHTLAEMKTYVREADGKMRGSPFDDRVISLAIAQQMRAHALAPEYEPERNDEWTFDWFARGGYDQSRQGYHIGHHNVRVA